MDLVSAIITTYKRPINILRRAISSILSQTYQNIELIVINDNPDDIALSKEIGDMLLTIAPHATYIVNEKNIGASNSRNIGIQKSNGKYIAFLDDDDEWMPSKIESQYNEIIAEPNIGLVHGNFMLESPNYSKMVKVIHPKNPLKELVKLNYIGSTSIPLINCSIARKVGGFDPSLRMGEDYDLWIRIASISKIKYVNKLLIKYYVSNDSTFRFNHKNRVLAQHVWNKKYEKIFEKYKFARCYGLNMGAIRTITNGKKDFRAYFAIKKMAIKLQPFNLFNYIFLPWMFAQELKWKICSK